MGSLTARAEAQIVRLSLIYAVLDLSDTITLDHLLAAKAVWDYCEQSVRYLFTSCIGNSLAEQIHEEIVKRGEPGMTQTEISNHFRHNKSSAELKEAIDQLIKSGRIYERTITTGGRPKTVYFANVPTK